MYIHTYLLYLFTLVIYIAPVQLMFRSALRSIINTVKDYDTLSAMESEISQ